MKKTLTIAKIIVIFILLFGILKQTVIRNVEVIEGYCDKLSTKDNDTIHFYANCSKKSKVSQFYITDIFYQKRDSFSGEGIVQRMPSLKAYAEGFNFQRNGTYVAHDLKNGLYFLNNTVPFIHHGNIKEMKTAIVVPVLSMMALNNSGGKSFYDYNSNDQTAAETLSIKRPWTLDEFSQNFIRWVTKEFEGKAAIITDHDILTDRIDCKQFNCLVFYGYASFWTKEFQNKIMAYQNQGGNLILLGSTINNLYLNMPDPDKLYFKRNVQEVIDSPHTHILCTPISYLWGNEHNNTNKHYIINSPYSPILAAIQAKDTLYCGDRVLSAPPCKQTPAGKIQVNLSRINFHKAEIIAYVPGTVNDNCAESVLAIFQKSPESGEIFAVGNNSWLKEDFLKMEKYSDIIKKAILIYSQQKTAFSAH